MDESAGVEKEVVGDGAREREETALAQKTPSSSRVASAFKIHHDFQCAVEIITFEHLTIYT